MSCMYAGRIECAGAKQQNRLDGEGDDRRAPMKTLPQAYAGAALIERSAIE